MWRRVTAAWRDRCERLLIEVEPDRRVGGIGQAKPGIAGEYCDCKPDGREQMLLPDAYINWAATYAGALMPANLASIMLVREWRDWYAEVVPGAGRCAAKPDNY